LFYIGSFLLFICSILPCDPEGPTGTTILSRRLEKKKEKDKEKKEKKVKAR
jgi:hypothetical protein